MKNILIPVFLLLSSCASQNHFGPVDYLKKTGLADPIPAKLAHCYQYGCQKIIYTDLRQDEQIQIEALFEGDIASAEGERVQISKAIGMFERIIGGKTGTEADIYGTFRANGPFQQDCVDESVNTTIYLRLLENMGLLRYHKVLAPDTRFPLVHGGRWPHRTAVILDNGSGQKYAIDSWFHDNGFDAEVVLLEDWKKGWKPQIHKRKGDDFHLKP